MKVEIKNGKMYLEIETNAVPTPSKQGKTLIVATSHGNQPTGAAVEGKPVIIGVNAYIARPAR